MWERARNVWNRLWNTAMIGPRAVGTALNTVTDAVDTVVEIPKRVLSVVKNTIHEMKKVLVEPWKYWKWYQRVWNIALSPLIATWVAIEWAGKAVLTPAEWAVDTWNTAKHTLKNGWRSTFGRLFSKKPLSDFSYDKLQTANFINKDKYRVSKLQFGKKDWVWVETPSTKKSSWKEAAAAAAATAAAAASAKEIANLNSKISSLTEENAKIQTQLNAVLAANKKYISLLKNYSKELEGQVEHKNEKLLEMQDSIITGIASLVESRDNSTGNHIRRTSEEVKIFVKKLKAHEEFAGYSEGFYTNVAKAATLHDLGKIAVDDKVLRKPGIFDDADYEQMKKHCKEGAKIVAEVLKDVDDEEFKTTAINIAHYHHERWDGTGYPSQLKEKEIPVEARIMALADVFDALVSKLCYKEAYSFDEAFKIIEENLGTHFDPVLGRIFMECRPELETLYSVNSLAE